MSVEADLITAIQARLTGTDAHGQPLMYEGNQVPVYTGSPERDAKAPYLIIDRPRTRGDETLDGHEMPQVRQQLRVHTSAPPGRGDFLDAYDIAHNAHDLLEAAPLSVDGKDAYVPEPDRQPAPLYDRGDTDALDLAISYIFHL